MGDGSFVWQEAMRRRARPPTPPPTAGPARGAPCARRVRRPPSSDGPRLRRLRRFPPWSAPPMPRFRSTRCFARSTGFAGTTRPSPPRQPEKELARTVQVPVRFQQSRRASPGTSSRMSARCRSGSARPSSPISASPIAARRRPPAPRPTMSTPGAVGPYFNKLQVLLLHRADAEAGREQWRCRSSSRFDRSVDGRRSGDGGGEGSITLSYTFLRQGRDRHRRRWRPARRPFDASPAKAPL